MQGLGRKRQRKRKRKQTKASNRETGRFSGEANERTGNVERSRNKD